MPLTKYIRVSVSNQDLDLQNISELPVSISYRLEDPENFQRKKSSEAFNIAVPATVNNDQIANTFHNPGVEDLSPDSAFRKNQPGFIESNSFEVLVGKAFLTKATHNDKPIGYEYDFYGNNADWMIDLEEATLFDFLKHINFTFTKQYIIDSWAYDGTNESLPFVFAPVRYGRQMDDFTSPGTEPQKDRNMKPEYMKPAISKYWLIYWAFKSLGYRVSSQFLDTPFFRRQVMPWTWGNFLFSEGTRLNNLDFLAKSVREVSMLNQDYTGYWDLLVSNDSTNGAFDNNGVYHYDAANKEMKWTYLPAFPYGSLEATYRFSIALRAVVTANSDLEVRVQWFKNGVRIPNGNDNGNGTLIMDLDAPAIGRRDFAGIVDDYFTVVVDPGDVVSCKVFIHSFDSGTGIARIHASIEEFGLEYFRIPIGGLINFENYTGFKKYKFLDFLRGVVDEFNLSIQTDPISKVVVVEPTHPYSLTNDLSVKSGGYFNGHYLNWNEKQDISKISEIELYSDSERELVYKYKDDGNDGILKVVQDRYTNTLGAGKYVLPDRFKTGKRDVENRFFSPVMHYEVDQWRGLGTDPAASPQIICLIPENISNTSREEAQNTFEPKSAYYKGMVTDVGWIFDNEVQNSYPFMFAVNYKPGGENDPVLSYSDERIGNAPAAVLAKGLLKRFYWQRLAIIRNGQHYKTFFKLSNIDITNWFHREHIECRGQKWELVEINEYKPLLDETTGCFLRKWAPIMQLDFDNTFPSAGNVLDTSPVTGTFDIKYAQLKCLISDIPVIT